MEDSLNIIGQKFVDRIKDQFDKQGLNNTGQAKESLSYQVKDNKLIIEGKARALFLEFGRAPGKPPPFQVIKDWVIRKLKPPEEAVWIITKTIVDKIAEKGTDIFTDKAKGLQIEIILDDLNKELLTEITIFKQAKIINGLIKKWQLPK